MTESCDGVCYNSYQHSQQIGPNAQYSYDGGDKCVPVEDICQGISYSQEDVEICNEELKCIQDVNPTFKQEEERGRKKRGGGWPEQFPIVLLMSRARFK